jgi:hypothetical protein
VLQKRNMKIGHQIKNMKNQMRALFLGVTFSLAAAGVSHAMSELVSLSQEPVWPASPTADGSLVYNITTVARGGAGLLEVTLTAGAMPPGVTVTFSPSVLRFTGNQLSSQTATMTVSSLNPLPLDSYPFTITGTALRETVTATNLVTCSPEMIANRPPTLYLDGLTNGVLRIRGLGATGKTYEIQAATDMSSSVWTPLGTASADGNGRFTFFTSQVAGSSTRLYRAVLSK